MDLSQSIKELDYWKETSREYLSRSDFERHKNATIKERRKKAILHYIVIGTIYVSLAIFCIVFPNKWKDQEPQVKLPVNVEEVKPETVNIIENDSVSRSQDTVLYHSQDR